MQATEFEKSKSHILIEIIESVSNSVVTKIIIGKTTGNIIDVAIDTGEAMVEKISPFDTFNQVIERAAEICIIEKQNILQTDQVILIPAHTSNVV